MRAAWPLLPLALLLALASPVAAKGRFEAACMDAPGDLPTSYASVDVRVVESRPAGDGVAVVVTLEAAPNPNATYSLAMDFEGDAGPDLLFASTGGGSLRGALVTWGPPSHAEGSHDLAFAITGNGFAASSLPGSKWSVTVFAAVSTPGGTARDEFTCASASSNASPGATPLAVLGVLAGAAAARRLGH